MARRAIRPREHAGQGSGPGNPVTPAPPGGGPHADWTGPGKYIDGASASDFRGRAAWRRLLDEVAQRRCDAVLVFKLNRAFRSVRHMHQTLDVWEPLGIGFLSAQAGFDTRPR